jgi:GH24 family phage-related lysozyme (muramidase)
MAMATSRNGLLFVGNREALVLTAYQDGKHCSVGFGSNSPALRLGDTISVRDAFALLKRDIAEREKILNRAIKVSVSQQQWDALISFYYQNGQKPDGQGRRGFDHMAGLINAGKFDEAAAYFPECDRNSAGEQKAGLRKRRLLEQAVFLRGDYGDLDPLPYWPGAPVGPPKQYHLQPGDLDD